MVIFGLRKRVKELEKVVKIQQETINQMLKNEDVMSHTLGRVVDHLESELVKETRERIMKHIPPVEVPPIKDWSIPPVEASVDSPNKNPEENEGEKGFERS